MSTTRGKFIAAVLGYALACRLLPYALNLLDQAGFPIDPHNTWYPWNFSPLWAVFAFCGAVVPSKRWAIALPLGMMVLSDLLMNIGHSYQFGRRSDLTVQAWVYASFALTAGIGMLARKHPGWLLGIPAAMLSTIVFYLTTNYAMWAFGRGEFYPETIEGLWACYAGGLPFLKTSVASTAIYAGLFFSPWGLGLAGVTRPVSSEPAFAAEPAYETAKG